MSLDSAGAALPVMLQAAPESHGGHHVSYTHIQMAIKSPQVSNGLLAFSSSPVQVSMSQLTLHG